jgi:phosphate:Na+ symporter
LPKVLLGVQFNDGIEVVRSKKIKHKYEFSKEGAAELDSFHKRILENLKFAFSVFIDQDVSTARKLIEEKTKLRAAELSLID